MMEGIKVTRGRRGYAENGCNVVGYRLRRGRRWSFCLVLPASNLHL